MSEHKTRPARSGRFARTIGVMATTIATAVLPWHAVAQADPAPRSSLGPVPSLGCATAGQPAGYSTQSFSAVGRSGDYMQEVPAAAPRAPMPVVFDMHGYMQPAFMQDSWSEVAAFGNSHGFVAITPETTAFPPKWDYGPGGADIGYISALLTHIERTLCVDQRRVYMTGLSMGAFMSSSVACQLSTRFAAVAPVAGLQNLPWCRPTRRVPIVAFHGTGDRFLAYNGGAGPMGDLLPADDGSLRTMTQQMAADPHADDVPMPESIPDQAAGWARRNGCQSRSSTQQVTPDVTRTVFACPADSPVELYTVADGGHTWPGGNTSFVPASLIGKVATSISANEIMWDFFRAHPLPAPTQS